MRLRLEEELSLLREPYGAVVHVEAGGEDWFQLPSYATPDGWQFDGRAAGEISVCFLIKGDYPGAVPYGFLTPAGLNFNGQAPRSTSAPPKPVPFAGDWLHFSWTLEDWAASAEVRDGSNLLVWCRGFAVRLREGA